jgi:GT2 family glycosyltransferase
VYDTDSNKRTDYTIQTYQSLVETTNSETTRIIFIDNDSCQRTKKFLSQIKNKNIYVITNNQNIGTAEAINLALKTRNNEYCIKMDNDVVVNELGWVEKMIRCFEKDPKLGILGLKRVDLPNSPTSKEYPTELKFLPHELGEPWLIVEECKDIIGTCTMYSPKLIDKVGYLYQPSIYGFDDVLMCSRSILSGFYNAFYPSVEIQHIDDGKNPYTEWKRKYAGIYLPKIEGIIKEYTEGTRPIYYNPFE